MIAKCMFDDHGHIFFIGGNKKFTNSYIQTELKYGILHFDRRFYLIWL